MESLGSELTADAPLDVDLTSDDDDDDDDSGLHMLASPQSLLDYDGYKPFCGPAHPSISSVVWLVE